MRRLLVIIFMLSSTPSGAFDGLLPRFDVEKYCTELASMGGSLSETMKRECFKMEQESYDGLKPKWQNTPPHTKNYCVELASFMGASYTMLSECLKMETSSRHDNSSTQFKY